MDLNDFRAWFTVVMFVIFIGIFWWAWSGRSKQRFAEAANLPFEEPEHPRVENELKEPSHE